MIPFFYKTQIGAGETISPVAHLPTIEGSFAYLASVNFPTKTLFISGAAANVTITMQCAWSNQLEGNIYLPPLDADYQTVYDDDGNECVFNKNINKSFRGLGSLWIRFIVNNTSGIPVAVSIMLD
jgi:hypothetical protein